MLILQRPEISLEEVSEHRSRFTIEPLEPGFGLTLGNTMRRALLSRVPGVAVTGVKIEGVNHEFTSIPGVVEDVLDVLLNLKRLVLNVEDMEDHTLTVKAKGPGEVNASQIQCPAGVEVVNTDLKICTLSDDANLEMEVSISHGVGYILADKNKTSDSNFIPIDSIFNPITSVSWDVQPIATSTEGHEKLTMEIRSDGSTTPKDAINHAANITRQQLAYFMFNDSSALKAVNEEEINEALEIKGILTKSIDEMELSVRSHNCLQAAGIKTISELVINEESEMLKFKNFGRKSLTELQEKLGELELHFGMDVKQYLETE